jgi:hypothetical protein
MQTELLLLSVRCVALFNVLYSVEQKVEMLNYLLMNKNGEPGLPLLQEREEGEVS